MADKDIISEFVVAALSGGIAGYLVARYSNKAAALDRHLDQIVNDIRELEVRGGEYWQMPGDSPAIKTYEMQIKGVSKRIGTRINILARTHGVPEGTLTQNIMILRRSVMLGEFERNGRRAEPNRHMQIQNAANELEAALLTTANSINFGSRIKSWLRRVLFWTRTK